MFHKRPYDTPGHDLLVRAFDVSCLFKMLLIYLTVPTSTYWPMGSNKLWRQCTAVVGFIYILNTHGHWLVSFFRSGKNPH